LQIIQNTVSYIFFLLFYQGGYSSLGSNNSIFKSPSNQATSSQSSSVHRSATTSGSSSSESRSHKEDLYKQMMRAKIQRDVRITPNSDDRSHASKKLPSNLNLHRNAGGRGAANSIRYNHKI
jgi:hypothetical protein